MNFNLRKPCKKCPFLDNENSHGWLGEERAEEIIDSITRRQQSFPCHKTTNHDDDGESIHSSTEEHCAGALIMLEKMNQPNQMMRISERFGDYDRTKLEMDSNVFEDGYDFIDAHGEL